MASRTKFWAELDRFYILASLIWASEFSLVFELEKNYENTGFLQEYFLFEVLNNLYAGKYESHLQNSSCFNPFS